MAAVKLIAVELPQADLQIDPAYQRLVVRTQVRWIVRHYDEVAFGRLLIARRSDGQHWVVDGQQRLMAARTLGMEKVPCLVFDSQGRQHEASVFKEINAQRTPVRPLAVHKAALEAREPEAVVIQASAEENGFEIGPGGSGSPWNVIASIATLRSIYRRGGVALLGLTLRVIKETWEGDPQATNNLVLAGLADFLHMSGDCHKHRHLVSRLGKMQPMSIVRYVTDHTRIVGGNKQRSKLFVDAIVAVYNKQLRNNRLLIQGKRIVLEGSVEEVEGAPEHNQG